MLEEIKSSIKIWQEKEKHYGAGAVDADKIKIFDELDKLAVSAPKVFVEFLSSDQIIVSKDHKNNSNKFFIDYIKRPESNNVFLRTCSADNLPKYIKRRAWYLRENIGRCEDPCYIVELHEVIKYTFLLLDSCTGLTKKQGDEIRLEMLKLLPCIYRRLPEYNLDAYSNDFLDSAISLSMSLHDVNITYENSDSVLHLLSEYDIIPAHKPLVLHAMQALIKRGADITIASYDKKSRSLFTNFNTILFDNEQITYEFFTFALDLNPNLSGAILEEAMMNAITHGNKGAIKALHPRVIASDKYIHGIVKDITVQHLHGIMQYLKLSDMSVYDMLEQVASLLDYKKLSSAVRNLFFSPEYREYELEQTPGLNLYLAEHQEEFLRLPEYKAAANAKIAYLVKEDEEICPLTTAIKNNNVDFLIFAIKIAARIEVKKDRLNINERIIKAVHTFIDREVDVQKLTAYLRATCLAKWRPNRWLTFEHTLLNDINLKFKINETNRTKQDISKPSYMI